MQNSFAQIKSSLLQAPLPPDIGEPSGASSVEIEIAENALTIQFPSDLKEWLHVVNSSCVGGGGFVGVNSRLESLDMEMIFDCYPQWKEKSWFPVASDGSGNYYVLFSNGEKQSVAFIDVAEDPGELTYVVASSLVLFLDAFIRKESGDNTWPFREQAVLQRDPDLASIKVAPMPWE